jgi:polyhydroxyalkanoate synthesis regulator phasin
MGSEIETRSIEMSRRKKMAAVVAGAAAFAIAGGGAAVAASEAFSPEEESKAVIDDAADQLGVESDDLTAALKQALQNRIDEAVAAGRLTEEQGEQLKERIASADTPLLGALGAFGGHHGFGGPRGFGGRHLGLQGLDTAASFLGMTESELRAELEDGSSLADVARAERKSVEGLVQALVAAAEKKIDAAVDDGKLTEAQAAEIREDLDERITDLVNREPGSRPELHRDGFAPRQGSFSDDAWPGMGPRA